METEAIFSESCQTIALRKENLFISAFPGKIVLGETNYLGYKKNFTLTFFHFQLVYFYLSIVKIIEYFSCDSSDEQGIIISINKNYLYYWCGKSVFIEDTEEKVVKIGIQQNDEITFELIFTAIELNEMIFVLPQIIISSLCLKTIERNSFDILLSEASNIIVSLNNKKNCEKYIKKKVKVDEVIQENIADLFIYYNEIILIVHKLKTLYNSEMNQSNIEKLLK
jgi:hypothetical protein